MKSLRGQREIAMHRIPCGPVAVNASGVCRRRLHDTFDKLLDRICEDCYEYQPPEIPEGHELTEDGRVMSKDHLKKQAKTTEKIKKTKEAAKKAKEKEEAKKVSDPTPAQKKKQMIAEGKMKVDVKKEVKEYEDKVMGNSKMGQDISGEIKKR